MNEQRLRQIGVTLWVERRTRSGPSVQLGNGYRIAPDLVATCAHILGIHGEPVERVRVLGVDGGEWTGRVAACSEATDCAIIALEQSAEQSGEHSGQPFSLLATVLPGEGADWQGIGVLPTDADASPGSSLAVTKLDGKVDYVTETFPQTQIPAHRLLVHPERKLTGVPPDGLCGMALVVAGRIIGHLIGFQPHPDTREMRNGSLYAAPVSGIWELLRTIERAPTAPTPRRIPLAAGSTFHPEHFLEREESAKALKTLRDRRGILIYGPRFTGKTWIVQYLTRELRRDSGYVVIDPELMDNPPYRDIKTLCKNLYHRTKGKLLECTPPLPFDVEAAWPAPAAHAWNADPVATLRAQIGRLMRLFMQYKLRVVLILDNAHRIDDDKTWQGFFSFLRGWQEILQPEWDYLKIVVSLPERPSELIRFRGPGTPSPFNLPEQNIQISRFTRRETRLFFEKYALVASEPELHRLNQLFEYDPYWMGNVAEMVINSNHTLSDWLRDDPAIDQWAKVFIINNHSHLLLQSVESFIGQKRVEDFGSNVTVRTLLRLVATGQKQLGDAPAHQRIRHRLWREGLLKNAPDGACELLGIYERHYRI